MTMSLFFKTWIVSESENGIFCFYAVLDSSMILLGVFFE
ncbi:hypothetical protein AmDm5_1570 [Acetobacter malorum]|nr:hypothetical protein AmDm5_1570 [Acetobacter malorum]